jgi:hypothetical protein
MILLNRCSVSRIHETVSGFLHGMVMILIFCTVPIACDTGLKTGRLPVAASGEPQTGTPGNPGDGGTAGGIGNIGESGPKTGPGNVSQDPPWIRRLEPEEIEHFKGQPGVIKLKWATQSEENNFGFNIFRSDTKDGEYRLVNEKVIMGAGNSSTKNTYTYYDKNLEVGLKYYYYLVDINFEGVTNQITPEIPKEVEIVYLPEKDPDYQDPDKALRKRPKVEESSID